MSLIEDAVMAKKLGYKSYGEYMLKKGPPPPPKRYEGPICSVCGKPLPDGRRQFCSRQCCDRHHYLKRKAAAFV